MLNKLVMLLVITTIIMGSVYLIPDIDALSKNTHYAILSEKYFFVIELDNKNNVITKDGGIWYNSEWRIINMTGIKVEQYGDKWDNGGIIGNLKSGEKFWFTWILNTNNDVVTKAIVYDEKTLTTMSDDKAYMARLFFPG